MYKITLVAILLLCITSYSYVYSSKGSKLVVILLDGFKWNYFDKPGLNLPGFNNIIRNGVRAERMIPDMPSLSFPNYYSIMTGVHCENHGFVGNYMYDESHKEKFLIWKNKPTVYKPYWWSGAEPVWVTAMKQGKRAYMYRWRGCEVMIEGRNATYCKLYNGIPSVSDLGDNIDDAVLKMKTGSADLVAIYVEMSDHVGHAHGPNSREIDTTIMEIDKQIQHLWTSLEQQGLKDDVNVMIVSDHGMTEISPSRVIDMTTDINMNDVDVILDRGPTVNIWPKKGKFEKPKDPDFPTYTDSGPLTGFHGYDNIEPEMGAIFVGIGPDFKANHGVKPFANVNLYQMMCHLLRITPAPNNGTWSTVSDMLIDEGSSASSNRNAAVCHLPKHLIIIFLFICFYFAPLHPS